jgi:hypothetical protein
MNTNVTEVWNEFVAALETAYTGEFVAALETATCQEPKGSLYNRGLVTLKRIGLVTLKRKALFITEVCNATEEFCTVWNSALAFFCFPIKHSTHTRVRNLVKSLTTPTRTTNHVHTMQGTAKGASICPCN